MSFLRSSCAGRRLERGLECARRTGERGVNVPGVGDGTPGLVDVADHQANGSIPAIESGELPAGEGNASFAGTHSVGLFGCTVADGFVCPLPVPSPRAVADE